MRTTMAISAFALHYLCACTTLAIGPSTIFSDGDFDDSDWSLLIENSDFGAGLVTAQQVLTGGNPGEYRLVSNDVETVSSSERSTIFGYHESATAIYDPALSGAITSIKFNIDYIDLGSEPQGLALVLTQGGIRYVSSEVLQTSNSGGSWVSLAERNYGIGDFSILDKSTGTRDPAFQPDFSSAADPIQLGFVTIKSIPPGNSPGTLGESEAGYDNWAVTVVSIPEPTTCTLALAALSLFIRRDKQAA